MYTPPGFNPSVEYVEQEARAVQSLLDLGVTLDTPVTLPAQQRRVGHTMCAYHLTIKATGEVEDGGAASTILSLLTDGTYGGEPGDYTLVPCN